MSFDKLHHQKRHCPARHAEISHGDYVRMTNRRRGECFLAETRREHWIVADEIRQDHFDSVLGFQKDVTRMKDCAHAALAEPPLEQVARIDCGFANESRCSRLPVLRTGVSFVRVATPALGAFFHLWGVYIT